MDRRKRKRSTWPWVAILRVATLLVVTPLVSEGCRSLASYASVPQAPDTDRVDTGNWADTGGPTDTAVPTDTDGAAEATVDVDALVDAAQDGAELGLDAAAQDGAKLGLDAADDGGVAASCAKLFGSAPGFLFCNADSTSCTFYYDASPARKSCDELCKPYACLGMKDNAQSNSCDLEQPNICVSVPCTCTSTMHDSICTCSR